MMHAYRYTYGDGSQFWDCYASGRFVARAHSWAEVTILASARNLQIRES